MATDQTTSLRLSLTQSDATNILAQIPTSTSGTCTFTLETFSNSGLTAKIGSSETMSLTINVGSGLVPTIGSSGFTMSEGNSSVYNALSNTDYFLTNVSSVKFNSSATAPSGTSIESYSVSFNNKTLTGAETIFSVPSTAGTNYSATLTVKDKRGRTATKSISNIKVINYTQPSLSSVSIQRDSTTTTTVVCK